MCSRMAAQDIAVWLSIGSTAFLWKRNLKLCYKNKYFFAQNFFWSMMYCSDKLLKEYRIHWNVLITSYSFKGGAHSKSTAEMKAESEWLTWQMHITKIFPSGTLSLILKWTKSSIIVHIYSHNLCPPPLFLLINWGKVAVCKFCRGLIPLFSNYMYYHFCAPHTASNNAKELCITSSKCSFPFSQNVDSTKCQDPFYRAASAMQLQHSVVISLACFYVVHMRLKQATIIVATWKKLTVPHSAWLWSK